VELLQQLLQLIVTALNVADGVGAHSPQVSVFSHSTSLTPDGYGWRL
jgi:phosphotransacetylase